EEIENRKNEFFKTIENKNSDFYVLKHGGSIVAFCSFTPDVNGNLYLESLNTESEAKGTMIGSEFLPSVLEKVQTLGKDIYGQVNAKNPGTLPYYERIGFEIKNVEENGELKYYEIRIPAEKFTRKAA
ncbi:GNAT family N-acetyltransferase, partial [Candidatus Nomurabacteria bacterium]|nr:GNAT family N-acetyltransferase [Candidatus Nomurabacteria bacterium]